MDFAVFFLGYIVVFSVVAVIVMFSSSVPFLSSLLDKLKEAILKVVHAVIPGILIRCVTNLIHYIFQTRNHVMQFVFGGLVMGGNIIFMLDILPLLYIFEPEKNHLLLPMVLLFSNAAAFHISCASDPGRVTPANVTMLASLYKADGVIYKAGVECGTCKIIKPPRSKHCRICNRCVHRFDHHCIWTNNCVGGGNVRFFLAFLLTLILMIINGAVVSIKAMILMVHHFKMLETGYMDPQTGQILPVTISILIQHLFMQHPRSIFLITSLIMLTLLLGLFTIYHLFLMISNQTTNERYKMTSLPVNNNYSNSIFQSRIESHNGKSVQKEGFHDMCSSQLQQHQNDNKSQRSYLEVRNSRKKNYKGDPSNKNVTHHIKGSVHSSFFDTLEENKRCAENRVVADIGSFYNRGLFQNIKEVILPWSGVNSIKQSKVNIFGHSTSMKKIHKR